VRAALPAPSVITVNTHSSLADNPKLPPFQPRNDNKTFSRRETTATTVAGAIPGLCTSFGGKVGVMSIMYAENTEARAVRLVCDRRDNYDSERAATKAISGQPGMNPETLPKWVPKSEIDAGEAPGKTTDVGGLRQRRGGGGQSPGLQGRRHRRIRDGPEGVVTSWKSTPACRLSILSPSQSPE
jgi:transposase